MEKEHILVCHESWIKDEGRPFGADLQE